MAKKYVKMAVYAEPGVGKSTFASKAPNVFFICTDGNYGWLGLPDEQHVQISNGPQFEKIIDIVSGPEFDWCDTIVVDLLEEAYLMWEASFCKKHKIESIADLDYGKGYDLVRKSFLVLISKLVSLPKHVIFLMHGEDDISTKDIRGNVITKHVPSPKLPKKLLSSVEGKVQYFLRAYIKAETSGDPNNGKVLKKRYLSLIPKPNDFGISRGADENNFPEDIELDWNVFAEVVGLNDNNGVETQKSALQMMLDSISDTPTRQTAPTKPNITASVVPPKPTTNTTTTNTTASAKAILAAKAASVKKAEVVKEEPKEEVKEEEPNLSLNKATAIEELGEIEEAPEKALETKKEEPKTEIAKKVEVKEAIIANKPVEETKVPEKKVSSATTTSVQDKLAKLKALRGNK